MTAIIKYRIIAKPAIWACLLLALWSSVLFNPLKAEQRINLYLPIVSALYPELANELQRSFSNAELTQIQVHNADFWHPYQQGVREGRVGIYFAQPHFAAWLITQHDFNPVFKLHGQLKYVLAARRSDTSIFEVSDLAGKRVCRESGLNLGTVWLNQVFGQHHLSSRSQEVHSAEQDMLAMNPDCDAFVLSERAYRRVNSAKMGKFIRLQQSPVYKHFAFVAHPDINQEVIKRVQSVLKNKSTKLRLKAYFNELSQWQNLLPINDGDYNHEDTELLRTYWQP